MYKSNKDPMAKIVKAEINEGSNSIEIKFSDGRELRLCANGAYNPNKIVVVYHSHEWNWEECEFSNFGYPQD